MLKKTIFCIFLFLVIGLVYYFNYEEKIIIKEVIIKPEEKEIEEIEEEPLKTIFVEIKGAIKKPGVYEVNLGDRIYNLIKLAGGKLKNADLSNINQAKILSDEMSIKIFTEEELKEEKITIEDDFNQPTLISINNSDIESLMTLPNIGEVTAKNIIIYRQENNGFVNIEDIMNVSGIGETTFAKIKDLITL